MSEDPSLLRAWKRRPPNKAAGVIHTDFEKGFIKAEVISFGDLVATGSIAEARAMGKARIESSARAGSALVAVRLSNAQ